jgi:hypothetical protein
VFSSYLSGITTAYRETQTDGVSSNYTDSSPGKKKKKKKKKKIGNSYLAATSFGADGEDESDEVQRDDDG